jgi:hypothetical protein
MRKTLVSILAVATVLSLAAAPASAHSHHGFGLGGLIAGFAGAVIGAEIVSHSQPSYPPQGGCFTRYQNAYDDYGNYIGRRPVQYCD